MRKEEFGTLVARSEKDIDGIVINKGLMSIDFERGGGRGLQRHVLSLET